MKKSILCLVAGALSLGLTSCNKDDDNIVHRTDGFPYAIVGEWKIEQFGEILNAQEVLTNYENECSTNHDRIEFTSTRAISTDYDAQCVADTDDSSYHIVGAALKVNSDEGVEEFQILTLNSTTMKLMQTDEDGNRILMVFARNK